MRTKKSRRAWGTGRPRGVPVENLWGRTYRHLRVLGSGRTRSGVFGWICLCDPELGGCGAETDPIPTAWLTLGRKISCGCKNGGPGFTGRRGKKNPEPDAGPTGAG